MSYESLTSICNLTYRIGPGQKSLSFSVTCGTVSGVTERISSSWNTQCGTEAPIENVLRWHCIIPDMYTLLDYIILHSTTTELLHTSECQNIL